MHSPQTPAQASFGTTAKEATLWRKKITRGHRQSSTVAVEERVRLGAPQNGAGPTDGAGEILVGDSVAPASSKPQ